MLPESFIDKFLKLLIPVCQIWKIRKIFDLENLKKFQLGKLEKFYIWKIRKIFNL